jgi:hypothetical protein
MTAKDIGRAVWSIESHGLQLYDEWSRFRAKRPSAALITGIATESAFISSNGLKVLCRFTDSHPSMTDRIFLLR